MTDQPRVCLLTGSAGVLGSAVLDRCAERYRFAALWYRRRPLIASQDQSLVDPLHSRRRLRENGRRHVTTHADITDAKATAHAVDRILDRLGRIDVIVHAAAHREWSPLFADGSSTRLDRHWATNVRAVLTITEQVRSRAWTANPSENARENRNVIAVSSTAALRAYLGSGQSYYAASKSGLNMLVRHMAGELADLGVRVNALAPDTFPGLIETETVVDGVVRLDSGSMTGRIMVLDADGERWL